MGIGALRLVVALLSGALFGLGLAVSGMADPAKVIGFLDVAGDWDPTLAFVMGGAILVAGPAFRLIFRAFVIAMVTGMAIYERVF